VSNYLYQDNDFFLNCHISLNIMIWHKINHETNKSLVFIFALVFLVDQKKILFMLNSPSNVFSQSAVIPFKNGKRGVKILLIKSRKGNWIVPKGIIEQGLTPQESARREAIEEAGVDGEVFNELIGEYNYDKWSGICNVKVYLMMVNKECQTWEEDYFRVRKWFSLEKAIRKVSKPELSDFIKQVPNLLRKDKSNDKFHVAQ